ncbi:C40 family peptidase, partial [Loigolactobacillus iwatensis]
WGGMNTGWYKENQTWYHLANWGGMNTGWLQQGTTWYHLANWGGMNTSWFKSGNYWYYANNSGAMQRGWINNNGTWYHTDGTGAMQTGWIQDNGNWYYLTNSGAMQKGTIQVGGQVWAADSTGAMHLSVSGAQIVTLTKQQLGKPYVLGAAGPNAFDCSGLVQYVYKQLGINLPRTTYQQEYCGIPVSLNNLQLGDLLFWGSQGSSYHVAIYTGNGNVIMAPQPSETVKEQPMSWWMPQFARRIL